MSDERSEALADYVFVLRAKIAELEAEVARLRVLVEAARRLSDHDHAGDRRGHLPACYELENLDDAFDALDAKEEENHDRRDV